MAAADEPRTTMVECPVCGGAGQVETGEYRIDRFDGSISYREVTCRECDGTGGVEVDLEPITLEDLEEMTDG